MRARRVVAALGAGAAGLTLLALGNAVLVDDADGREGSQSLVGPARTTALEQVHDAGAALEEHYAASQGVGLPREGDDRPLSTLLPGVVAPEGATAVSGPSAVERVPGTAMRPLWCVDFDFPEGAAVSYAPGGGAMVGSCEQTFARPPGAGQSQP